MNQAIQFTGREWWDDEKQAVCFGAIANGFSLTCVIPGAVLLRRFPAAEDALSVFRHHRWDCEEEAEKAIAQGLEDAQGWVWLSSIR